MEHAKKMILVDPSLIERMNQPKTLDNPMSRLDTEMQKILNSKMEDREKCTIYLQILQRYLHYTQEERQPFELPIVNNFARDDIDTTNVMTKTEHKIQDSVKQQIVADETSKLANPNIVVEQTPKIDYGLVQKEQANTPLYTTKQILRVIPKTYIKKGELLLGSLSENKNRIDWNCEGTVFIDKEKIPGSNIVDLVNDFIRPTRKTDPIGWEKFAKVLKELNVPLTYLGNTKRIVFISQLELNDHSKFTPRKELNLTPGSSDRDRDKAKKKIDWERWSPY